MRKWIRKRDGTVVPFRKGNVVNSIVKAFKEVNPERLNEHDAEIAELKREISDLKEAIELIFKLVKAMYENGNEFNDDDLFMITMLMKN